LGVDDDREGDPKGRCTVLVTALGSILGKPVPHGADDDNDDEPIGPTWAVMMIMMRSLLGQLGL
jgi:hypothetical protein